MTPTYCEAASCEGRFNVSNSSRRTMTQCCAMACICVVACICVMACIRGTPSPTCCAAAYRKQRITEPHMPRNPTCCAAAFRKHRIIEPHMPGDPTFCAAASREGRSRLSTSSRRRAAGSIVGARCETCSVALPGPLCMCMCVCMCVCMCMCVWVCVGWGMGGCVSTLEEGGVDSVRKGWYIRRDYKYWSG